MKRRLFNLAAGVSLLLAVAILFLWVRSYGRREVITRSWHTPTERRSWYVQSCYSLLDLSNMAYPDTGPRIAPSYEYRDETQRDPMKTHPRHWFPYPPVRFWHVAPRVYPPYDLRELTIAYWLLLPPTLILPTIAFVRHRRRRRREAGNLCPTCGYDLRAHNPGDRCPECGMLAKPRSAERATS